MIPTGGSILHFPKQYNNIKYRKMVEGIHCFPVFFMRAGARRSEYGKRISLLGYI